MGSSMLKLKDMLCAELDDISNSGPLNRDKLDIIDKLTHAIKSITTIEAMKDSGYSNRGSYDNYSNRWYDGHSMNSYGYYGGMSGDNSYRRYSRDEFKDHMMEKLNHMMNEASSEKDKEAIRRCMTEIGG